MLHGIQRFFRQYLSPPADEPPGADNIGADRVALAACALLLELAHADDEFSVAEREHIEEALTRHFALGQEEVRALIALAESERRAAVDLYQFTSLIATEYDEGQRMVLAEVMWRLVYADGQLAAHESYIMRKVSNLLDLRPGYLAEAKRRATQRSID